MQIGGDFDAVLRRGGRFAPATTGAVVDADPGGGGDVRGDPRHGGRGLTKAGFKHDGGAAGAGAVDVELVTADIDEPTRHRVIPPVGRLTVSLVAAAERAQEQ